MDNICIRIKQTGKADLFADCRKFAHLPFKQPMTWSPVVIGVAPNNKNDFLTDMGKVSTHKVLTVMTYDSSAARGTASTLDITNICEAAAGTNDKFTITLFAREGGRDAWDAAQRATDTAELKEAEVITSRVELDPKTKNITLVATFRVPPKKKK